ncbi:type II secretion system F family protein [Bacillus sp. FJAT-49711]|uniref:type II secretion system F family protein n=1 Tax=Bacillus sp. FJAT-49711 TaxID=2833585 RepID=UPI001BCA221D|nr:type II secretion system F family protein [Bacillus sp. FJAT-49711]
MNAIVLTGSATFFSLFISIYYFLNYKNVNKANKKMEKWFDTELNQERKSSIILIGDKYDRSELAEDLKKKLVQADIQLKPSEYAGICILLFGAFLFAGHFLFKLIFIINITLAYLIIWFGSKLFLKSRQNQLTEKLNRQLPEVCRMMSNTMKAGLTIPQGIEMVGEELKAPIGPEFKGMVQQLRLGTNFEDVMNQLRERFASKELNIFVSTVVIQHRVGGNLAEVLSIMADTLEERARVNKEVDTVTAEAKFIALILPIMPLMMALMMNLFIEGFLNPLFTKWGLVLLTIFIGMQLLAFLVIRKITTIRV